MLISCIAGLLLGYAAASLRFKHNFARLYSRTKAKCKAASLEAEAMLENSAKILSKQQARQDNEYNKKYMQLEKEAKDKQNELDKKQDLLEEKQNLLNIDKQKLNNTKMQLLSQEKDLLKQQDFVNKLKLTYEEKIDEILLRLEGFAGLTQEEARSIILEKTEENSRAQIAHIVRRNEELAKVQAKAKANYIIAQATSRFAGEYVADRLISTVSFKNDELKGRIIGKEGRNVKALEMTLGVDIIIDETPNSLTISCFNLYRRAIATKTVRLLLEDGRIHPARVERLHEKVCKQFEEDILDEGRIIAMDLGLKNFPDAIASLVGKLRYRASYGQNALAHSLEVAHIAGMIAAECGGNVRLAKRAGLLHDIGKALTHEQEGSHVDLGAMIAKRYDEDPVVINAIYAHHGHEEARSIEAAAVCAADTLSAARPGARREVLAVFLQRVSELEKIALSKKGVKKAYAIDAGREIRVIVNAKLINDDESVLLSKELAQEISQKLQYPGEIKVNIIREVRSVAMAR